ncbi:LAFA_0D13850g1_1 [Lachancea sp. 'fantastica']|nr:LAFA_0D13850g1_1 [Lachancea sp. 'fantastica']
MSIHALRIPDYALGEYSHNDKVVITGSFDNWEHTRHVLKFDNIEKAYNVTIPSGESDRIIFKFVINDKEWVTLPYFETQTDSRGLVNNVLCWSDHTENCLDNVTISSAAAGTAPAQEEMVLGIADTSHVELASPTAVTEPRSTMQNSPVEHDYIHVSSQDELSSTENLDLNSRDSYDCNDGSLVSHPSSESPTSRQGSPPASQKRLQSLVSVVKRVKMYWSG